MYPLFADDAFFKSLRDLDHQTCLAIKALRCPHCGGRLHTANYFRKPRGAGELETIRFSLCCCRDGCRRRLTPISLRFLGQKVYSAWVVILVLEFFAQLGLKGAIVRQTLGRWRNYWKERLSHGHPFMKWARSFLPPGIPDACLPSPFLAAFGFPAQSSWIPLLKFFTHPL